MIGLEHNTEPEREFLFGCARVGRKRCSVRKLNEDRKCGLGKTHVSDKFESRNYERKLFGIHTYFNLYLLLLFMEIDRIRGSVFWSKKAESDIPAFIHKPTDMMCSVFGRAVGQFYDF